MVNIILSNCVFMTDQIRFKFKKENLRTDSQIQVKQSAFSQRKNRKTGIRKLAVPVGFSQSLSKTIRSSRLQMFFKIGALKRFRNIHKKALVLESPFNNVAGLKANNFFKQRLQHMHFPVNIGKGSFFIEHLRWLLLNISP